MRIMATAEISNRVKLGPAKWFLLKMDIPLL